MQFERERSGIDHAAALVDAVRSTNAAADPAEVGRLAASSLDGLMGRAPIPLLTETELDRILTRVAPMLPAAAAAAIESDLHETRIDNVMAVVRGAIAESRMRDPAFEKALAGLKLPPAVATAAPTPACGCVAPWIGAGEAGMAAAAAHTAAAHTAMSTNLLAALPGPHAALLLVRRQTSAGLGVRGLRVLDVASLSPRADADGWHFVVSHSRALRASAAAAEEEDSLMCELDELLLRGAGADEMGDTAEEVPARGRVRLPVAHEAFDAHFVQHSLAVSALLSRTWLAGLPAAVQNELDDAGYAVLPTGSVTRLTRGSHARAVVVAVAALTSQIVHDAVCECVHRSLDIFCRFIDGFACVQRELFTEDQFIPPQREGEDGSSRPSCGEPGLAVRPAPAAHAALLRVTALWRPDSERGSDEVLDAARTALIADSKKVTADTGIASVNERWAGTPLCPPAAPAAGTLADPVVISARMPDLPQETAIVPTGEKMCLAFEPPLSAFAPTLTDAVNTAVAAPALMPDPGRAFLDLCRLPATEELEPEPEQQLTPEPAQGPAPRLPLDDVSDEAGLFDTVSSLEANFSYDDELSTRTEVSEAPTGYSSEDAEAAGSATLAPVPETRPWLVECRAHLADLATQAAVLPTAVAVLLERHAWLLQVRDVDVERAFGSDLFDGRTLHDLVLDPSEAVDQAAMVGRITDLCVGGSQTLEAAVEMRLEKELTDRSPSESESADDDTSVGEDADAELRDRLRSELRPAPLATLASELGFFERAVLPAVQGAVLAVTPAGLAEVTAADARDALDGAARHVVELLTDVVAARARARYVACAECWRAAAARVADPSTPENFDAARLFVRRLPTVRAALVTVLDDADSYAKLLDRFGASHKITDCVSSIHFATTGPKALAAAADDFAASLVALENRFTVELEDQAKTFDTELTRLRSAVGGLSELVSLTDTAENFARVQQIGQELSAADRTAAGIQARERILGSKPSAFVGLADLRDSFQPYEELWSVASAMQRDAAIWVDGPFEELDPSVVESLARERIRKLTAAAKWLSPGVNIAQLGRPTDAALSATFPATASALEAAQLNLQFLNGITRRLPLIRALRHPGMRPRHWEAVSSVLKAPVAAGPALTLSRFLELGVDAAAAQISRISFVAAQEREVELALENMSAAWREITFQTVEKVLPEGPVKLIAHADEIQQLLDDHIVAALALRSSPHVGPFEKRAGEWEILMQQVQTALDLWLSVQRLWLHLAPILSSPDIRRQLPAEAADFVEIDSAWRVILAQTLRPNAMVTRALTRDGLFDQLTQLLERLERVERGLDDYLEAARLTFPRFHFLSSEELVSILAQARFPQAVQPHLRKCFEGLHRIEFQGEGSDLTGVGIADSTGERLTLAPPVPIAGATPDWLLAIEQAMRTSVRTAVVGAATALGEIVTAEAGAADPDSSDRARVEWLQAWPAQAVLAVDAAGWAIEVEDTLAAVGAAGLHSLVDTLDRRLRAVVALVRDPALPSRLRASAGAFITQAVHARDVTARLAAADATRSSFAWRSVLRYTVEDDGVVVRQCDASVQYGYEYLGVSGRLVITPLTDRCFLTLTGALHNHLGGAPEGPAGTGKTETVKDLGKAVATYTLTFNGQESLNAASMARFIKGLALAGAWACFDEFNRIPLPVLSVVAEYIFAVQAALRAGAESGRAGTALIEGQTVSVRPTFATFITMNPGYAGRTELPDNLKALFRPVAMVVPDYALIAEIVLYSEGFQTARDLAAKIAATLRLSSEQLSAQPHYDFGMRAVKAILSAAGGLARAAGDVDPAQRGVHEEQLALRAIRDVSLPKFVAEDVPLFTAIVSDLFPGRTMPEPAHDTLVAALRTACAESGLAATDVFVSKALQLYDSLLVRHGVMVVGEALAGKSALITQLAAAMSAVAVGLGADAVRADERLVFAPVHIRRINPKALTLAQLYGRFDDASGEWNDGALAAATKEAAEAADGASRHWIVLDGPVDALWIENMNTVLDDNRKLCLSSGEVVSLAHGMSMLFETADLSQASPATVSRCGMVYVEPERLGWAPLLERLLRRGMPAELQLPADADVDQAAATHAAVLEQALADSQREEGGEDAEAAACAVARARALVVTGGVARAFRALGPALSALVAGAPASSQLTQLSTQHCVRSAMLIAKAMFAHLAALITQVPSSAAEDESEPSVGPPAPQFVPPTAPWTWATAPPRTLQAIGEAYTLFAVFWGFAGGLSGPAREVAAAVCNAVITSAALEGGASDLLVADWSANAVELVRAAVETGRAVLKGASKLVAVVPTGRSLLDVVPTFKSGAWISWADATAETTGEPRAVGSDFNAAALRARLPTDDAGAPLPDADPFEPMVPTLPMLAARTLLHVLFTADVPVLVAGPAGCGKSSLVRSYLLDGPGDVALPGFVAGRVTNQAPWSTALRPVTTALTAGSTAANVRSLIFDNVPKRRKRALGPSPGTRCAIFVDDLNLPAPEEYGAQPPLELLRTATDVDAREHGAGLHAVGGSFGANTFVAVEDVSFVAALRPVGGGAYPVAKRVLGRFALVGLPAPTATELQAIFAAPLAAAFAVKGVDLAVAAGAEATVAAAIQVHSHCSANIRAVPARPWYQLSVLDLKRLVRGVARVAPTALTSRTALASAFVHEAERVFGDRLADVTDVAALSVALRDAALALKVDPTDVLEPAALDLAALPDPTEAVGPIPALSRVVFTEAPVNALYMPAPDRVQLRNALDAALEDYNEANATSPMSIVLFEAAGATLLRLLRLISRPGGSALLIGTGGSGRRSLARLAAHVADLDVATISIGASYGIQDWHDDIRGVLRRAGLEGRPTVFLLTDSQLTPEYLRDVNTLVASGAVPGLWDADEEQSLVDGMMKTPEGARLTGRAALLDAFASRVRANLRFIICFSPSGDRLRQTLLACPSVATGLAPVFVGAWSADAQEIVAKHIISIDSEALQFDLDRTAGDMRAAATGTDADERVAAALKRGATAIEQEGACTVLARSVVAAAGAAASAGALWSATTGHAYHATPQSLVSTAHRATALFSEMHNEKATLFERYDGGLAKIAAATAQVTDLQAQLQALRPVLLSTQTETERLVAELHTKRAEAQATRATTQEEETRAAVAAGEARSIKNKCDSELQAALPALEAAEAALRSLKRADVIEVKSMKNPPAGVRLVLEAVCIMLGEKPVMVPDPAHVGRRVADYWPTSQRILGEGRFLSRLFAFDRDNLADAVVEQLRPFLENPNFTPVEAARVSHAASGLCAWVIALVQFHRVNKVVRPLRGALAEAETRLTAAELIVKTKRAELADIEAAISALEANFKAAQAKRTRLQDEQEQCVARLGRATQLLDGLGENRAIWRKKADALRVELACTAGDGILAAAVEAYVSTLDIGARTGAYNRIRAALASEGVPVSDIQAQYAQLRSTALEQSDWAAQGLPSNAFSLDNGALLLRSERWPYVIDPEGQAAAWIQAHCRSSGVDVRVARPDDSDVARVLETAARLGQPVLLTDCGASVDASIEPLIMRATFERDGATCARVGDGVVELTEGFRIYMCTRDPSPELSPELATSVCVVNFAVTGDGLGEQLLSAAIHAEHPELEEERVRLLSRVRDDRRALAAAETRILSIISASENLLDDQGLIDALGESTQLSAEIARRAVAARAAEQTIADARRSYVPLARRGVAVFFALQAMAQISSAYQISLAWFIDIFTSTIAAAGALGSTDPTERRALLVSTLTTNALTQASRGVFGADRPALFLLTALAALQGEGAMQTAVTAALCAAEWPDASKFIAEAPQLSAVFDLQPEWVSHDAWAALNVLAGALPSAPGCALPAMPPVPVFQAVIDSIAGPASAAWAEWAAAEDVALPGGSDDTGAAPPITVELRPLDLAIIHRYLRPSKFEPAAVSLAAAVLGPDAVATAPLDVGVLHARSSASRPVLFLLSSGSDPTGALTAYADEQGVGQRLQIVSLGEGQGPRAAAAVQQAAERGNWVLLQNLHVAGSWATELARLLESLRSSPALHRSFRLWMTALPSPDIPDLLIRDSVKCSCEGARGVRAAVAQAYSLLPQNHVDRCPSCPAIWTRLLFAAHVLHAAILERRRFGPIGWTRPYEFGDSDLSLTAAQLAQALEDVRSPAEVPFETIRALAGEVNYGGRVTDDVDRAALNELTARYIAPNVLEPAAQLPGAIVVPSPAQLADSATRAEIIASLPDSAPGIAGLASSAAILSGLSATSALAARLSRTLHLVQSSPGLDAAEAASGVATEAEAELETEAVPAAESESDARMVARLLGSLPAPPDPALLARRFPPRHDASLHVVIAQEGSKFARLVKYVRADLRALGAVFRGDDVLTPGRAAVLDSLRRNALPEAWRRISYASQMTAAGWVDDLAARVAALDDWAAAPSVTLPSFWLPGLYFPHGFLTAVLQDAARRTGLPVDELDLECRVLRAAPTTAPRTGAVVHGLFIEGAAWSHEAGLVELPPGETVAPLPPVQLLVVRRGDVDELVDDTQLEPLVERPNTHTCYLPLYRTTLRFGVRSTTGHSTNFIRRLGLPSALPAAHWALRGAALLCSTARSAE